MTKTPSPTRKAAAKAAPVAAAALSAGAVLLDGRPHPIRPLRVGALKRAMIGVEELAALPETAANATQLLGLMAETVANATGMTPQEVDDLADQGELQRAFARVMAFSGAKEAEPGEAASQGR